MSRTRSTNIFASIGKALFEANVGRINWRSNMWAVVGSVWDKRRIARPDLAGRLGTNEHGHFVKDDRVLVRKPFTTCPSAPVPQSDFYRDDKGRWWVPAVACKKCQYHQISTRTIRFPRCKFKAPDVAKAATDSLVQLGDLVNKAVKDTEKIMRGEA